MTQDEIIEMAREAGLWETRHSVEMAIGGVGELERFAALVASAEREACAKVCDEYDNGRHANAADLCATNIRARGQA
jgi:hypothetical protein